jgi:hypothetical protein
MLECPALLILLECYTINICASGISWKVISLRLQGYMSTEWQFPVLRICCSHSHNLLSITYPFRDSLPSVITHRDYIHVVPRNTNKTLVPSPVTRIPVHAHCPSTSLKMSAVQTSPAATNTSAVKETSFPLSSVNMNASDGELGHINRCSKPQCSSGYR